MYDEYEQLVDIYDFTCPLVTKRKKMVWIAVEEDENELRVL